MTSTSPDNQPSQSGKPPGDGTVSVEGTFTARIILDTGLTPASPPQPANGGNKITDLHTPATAEVAKVHLQAFKEACREKFKELGASDAQLSALESCFGKSEKSWPQLARLLLKPDSKFRALCNEVSSSATIDQILGVGRIEELTALKTKGPWPSVVTSLKNLPHTSDEVKQKVAEVLGEPKVGQTEKSSSESASASDDKSGVDGASNQDAAKLDINPAAEGDGAEAQSGTDTDSGAAPATKDEPAKGRGGNQEGSEPPLKDDTATTVDAADKEVANDPVKQELSKIQTEIEAALWDAIAPHAERMLREVTDTEERQLRIDGVKIISAQKQAGLRLESSEHQDKELVQNYDAASVCRRVLNLEPAARFPVDKLRTGLEVETARLETWNSLKEKDEVTRRRILCAPDISTLDKIKLEKEPVPEDAPTPAPHKEEPALPPELPSPPNDVANDVPTPSPDKDPFGEVPDEEEPRAVIKLPEWAKAFADPAHKYDLGGAGNTFHVSPDGKPILSLKLSGIEIELEIDPPALEKYATAEEAKEDLFLRDFEANPKNAIDNPFLLRLTQAPEFKIKKFIMPEKADFGSIGLNLRCAEGAELAISVKDSVVAIEGDKLNFTRFSVRGSSILNFNCTSATFTNYDIEKNVVSTGSLVGAAFKDGRNGADMTATNLKGITVENFAKSWKGVRFTYSRVDREPGQLFHTNTRECTDYVERKRELNLNAYNAIFSDEDKLRTIIRGYTGVSAQAVDLAGHAGISRAITNLKLEPTQLMFLDCPLPNVSATEQSRVYLATPKAGAASYIDQGTLAAFSVVTNSADPSLVEKLYRVDLEVDPNRPEATGIQYALKQYLEWLSMKDTEARRKRLHEQIFSSGPEKPAVIQTAETRPVVQSTPGTTPTIETVGVINELPGDRDA